MRLLDERVLFGDYTGMARSNNDAARDAQLAHDINMTNHTIIPHRAGIIINKYK